jgi:hypothetical protein
MDDSFPEYRTVLVVSDLHIGGYTGVLDEGRKDWLPAPADTPMTTKGARSFRIFRDAPALGWAIEQATGIPGPAALVLNGDILDFLAAPDAKGFDPEGALANLDATLADPHFAPVWQALRKFLDKPDRDLVLNLGNHDIELAMHDVSARFVAFLTGGDRSHGVRIIHRYGGDGFSCRVGPTQVRCVHGNAVDPWNTIDYARLNAVGEARRLHAREPPFKVNAGSTLVVEHMNAVKRRFQWIDLLKPEREGAALISAALDEGRKKPIKQLLENFFLRGKDLRRAMFVAADGEARQTFGGGQDPDHPEGDLARRPDAAQVERWLLEAQAYDAAGVTPLDLAGDGGDDGMLDASVVVPQLISMGWLKRPLREVLREFLPQDQSFNPFVGDEIARDLDRTTDPEVDFLVAGHTHLERCMPRRNGPGYYFNSGTWTKLVQIPTRALESEAQFRLVRGVLEEGSLEALLADLDLGTGPPAPLARSVRTVVRMERVQGSGVCGALWHVEGSEGHGFTWREVPGSARWIKRQES